MRKSSLSLGTGRGRDSRVSFWGRMESKLGPRMRGQGKVAGLVEAMGRMKVKRVGRANENFMIGERSVGMMVIL